VLPTILELVGVAPPSDIDGTSFVYALDDPTAAERHDTQYFEMFASRGIYHRGWKAVTFHPLGRLYDDGLDPDAPFEDDVWELYHVAEDASETLDLAADEPARLQSMIDLWWHEARRNDVLPLDNRPLAAIMNPRPSARAERERFVYYPHTAPVPESVAVNVRNRSHRISADVHVADGTLPNGIVLALGSVLGGFAFYLRDGRLRYVHNLYGKRRDSVASKAVVPPGGHVVAFVFTKTADFAGRAELFLDGGCVGRGEIAQFTPVRFSITGAGLTCGYERGPAIGDDYTAPFAANFEIERVVVDVSGRPYHDPEGEFEAIMSEQ
jgi:hypothetical protein